MKAFTKQRTLQLTMDMESTTFKLKDEGVCVFEPLVMWRLVVNKKPL